MAEDLGHFTATSNVIVEIDETRRNIKLRHPMSNDVILSLSTEAAWDLGQNLINSAFKAEKSFRYI